MNFLMNICIINAFIVCHESNQLNPVNRKKKRYTQLDFRVNLVMQLIGGFSSSVKKARSSMVIYPLGNGDPLSHTYSRLNRKRSTCKLCPKSGEKRRKETHLGCIKCNKHLCSEDCYRQFHAGIGVNITNVTEE